MMFMYEALQHPPVAPPWHAPIKRLAIRTWSVLAERLRAWLIERRIERATKLDFSTMSGHELHDMGLTRVDAPSVGWDAWIDINCRI
jgi:uncharacterized protein YjiS (DUF1127 family)